MALTPVSPNYYHGYNLITKLVEHPSRVPTAHCRISLVGLLFFDTRSSMSVDGRDTLVVPNRLGKVYMRGLSLHK